MKFRFKKKIYYSLLSIFLFIIASYFFFTSSFFVAKIFFPAFGKYIMKVDFSIEHAKFNPFTSYLEWDNAVVGDRNNPFIKVKKTHCYIDIFSLFKKPLIFKFHDIYLEDIDVNLKKIKKENWSIPWIYVTVPSEKKVQFAVDFTNIKISNMNIKYQQDINFGSYPLESELSNLDVSLKYLKNGILSPLTYKGKIKLKSSRTGIENSGTITGISRVNLGKWCIPTHIKIASVISDISSGKETGKPHIKERKISFDFEIKEKAKNSAKHEIISFRVRDIINSKTDSELNAYGQLNFYPFNLKAFLNAKEIHAPTQHILSNLLGNYDLGNGNLSFLGRLSVTEKTLKTAGELSLTNSLPSINDFQFSYGIPLNYYLNYSIALNHEKKSFVLKRLFSLLTKQKQELIRVELNKPMHLSSGKDNKPDPDNPPAINITTSNLNLLSFNKILEKDFKFLSGELNSIITLSMSPYSSNNFKISGITKTKNTKIEVTSNKSLIKSNLTQVIDADIEDYKNIKINKYELIVDNGLEKATKIKVTGDYNFLSKKGNIHTLIPYFDKSLLNFYQCFSNYNKEVYKFLEATSKFTISLDNEVALDLRKENLIKVKKLQLLFSNPERESLVTLSLRDQFFFILKQNKIILHEDIVLKSDVKNLDIARFLESLPTSFPFKLSKGNFTYDLLFVIPKEMDSIKIKGKIALLYSSLSFYNQYVKDLSITNYINAVLFDTKSMNLTDTTTEIYINGVQCLTSKTNGILAFNKTDDTSLIISIKSVNKYFANLFYDGISANINELVADGKIYCRFTQTANKSFFKGEINMSKAVFGQKEGIKENAALKGNLSFNIEGTKNRFNIDELNLLLQNQNKDVVQMDVSGNFPVPLKAGKAKIAVKFDKFALGEIATVYLQLSKQINKTFVDKGGHFEPIDFEGLNLEGDIKFNSLSYGKEINSFFHSKLNISDNKITLSKEKAELNGTNIQYHGEIDTNQRNGFPYVFNAKLSNLDLTPFIKTFISGDYKKAGGTVNSFHMSVNGKGFSKENLRNNLTGKMKIILSNLSIPYQINQLDELKFLLAPIVILEQIREKLPGGFLVTNFEKGIKSTKEIMNNQNNIELKSGIIDLSAEKGLIMLNKVLFLGTENDLIDYSYFDGTVDFDGNMDIYSKSNLSGIIAAFYIEGTIEKPVPDFSLFIPRFMVWNIFSLINPVNIAVFVYDLLTGIYKTLEGLAVSFWDIIISPFTSADTVKDEKVKKDMNHEKSAQEPAGKEKVKKDMNHEKSAQEPADKEKKKKVSFHFYIRETESLDFKTALLPAINPVLQQT